MSDFEHRMSDFELSTISDTKAKEKYLGAHTVEEQEESPQRYKHLFTKIDKLKASLNPDWLWEMPIESWRFD